MAFPRTRKSLVSFNGGELSPKMDARNDTEKYQVGCRQFKNFLPLPHGGATRRRGFEYIATSKYSSADKPARMLRFQFSQNDGLILELGDYYVRFFTRDGGAVMDPMTPSIPYELETPYSSAQAFAVQTAQVNDVVYIAHPLFPQHKLTRLANDDWTLAPVVFDLPAFIDLNVSTTTLAVTPATVGTGRTMQASASLFTALHVGSYWRIGHHRDAATIELPITVNGTSSNIAVLGKWTVNTYGTWTADIFIENSVDNGTTWERVRKYTSKNDANVSDAGEQEDVEALYRIVVGWTSGSGRVVFGVADGRVFGLVKITAITDADTATVDVIKAVYATTATTYWNEGAWSEYRGYPTSLAFFQQRLWFGGSAYQPQTFWGSVTDDYEDFSLGTNADSGLAFTLASEERNQILWMVGQRRLVLGTSGGVWAAYGDELEAAITATKPPLVLKQNQIPCAYQRPIFINGSILFIQSSGRKLRELVLDGSQGIYDDSDMTILSDQISAGGLLTPCYQQDRDSLVWCTTGLGNLVSMTYEKKQNVIAWARHTTPGIFESCDTIKGAIDDEVWVCVRRLIAGEYVRCIERMKGYYTPSVDGSHVLNDYGPWTPATADAFDYTTTTVGTENPSKTVAGITVTSASGFVGQSLQVTVVDENPILLGVPSSPLTLEDLTENGNTWTAKVLSGLGSGIYLNGTLASFPGPAGGGLGPVSLLFSQDVAAVRITAFVFQFSVQRVFFQAYRRDGSLIELFDAAGNSLGTRVYATQNDLQLFSVYSRNYDIAGISISNNSPFGSQPAIEKVDFLTETAAQSGTPATTGIPSEFTDTEVEKTFLDSSVIYVGAPISTITGLDHLEGESVSLLVDGLVVADQTVEGGEITLSAPASVVHVGLPYESVLQPMRIDTDNQIGGSQGLVKRVHQIVFRFLDTQGPYSLASTPTATPVSIPLRAATPTTLYTGDAPPWDYSADYDPDATFIISQSKPLPLTLLGAFVKYQITES